MAAARCETSRERFLAAMDGRPTGRPVVVCPGGMMSMAVTEVMAAARAPWPEAHRDGEAMVRLALAMQEATGFDNVAMPFCMTVEAEAYGARVDLGNETSQPRVRGWVLEADGSTPLPEPDFAGGRAGMLLGAIRAARAARPDVAIIGNLVGPFSLLGMLADPLRVLRWTRRQPEAVHRYLGPIAEALGAFGVAQAAAGADAICIAEPTATGEILGGTLFGALAAPYLARVAARLRQAGVRVIVHICGDARPIEKELRGLEVEAVSFDSMVDLRAMVCAGPPWRVMGNVSTFTLADGPVSAITKWTRVLAAGGVRLLAPACGVVPTTPAANLRAMREAVGEDA